MERAEALGEHVTVLERDQENLAARLAAAVAARDAAMGEYATERDAVAGRRAATVTAVGEDLVALYERIRSGHAGIGAAELRQRRCGGCHIEPNQVDMNRIIQAPADEVLRCSAGGSWSGPPSPACPPDHGGPGRPGRGLRRRREPRLHPALEGATRLVLVRHAVTPFTEAGPRGRPWWRRPRPQ